MMKTKRIFSPAQQAAIDTRDRTLLVSASAGSGKTTTLTERIIRSILDEENPQSLQEMLIVTFTNASVADLNDKISGALKAASEERPENERIRKELYMLPSAKIRTIDAFCNDILRANCERLGISPGYRIAEDTEIAILTEATFEYLINAAYRGELEQDGVCATDFKRLCSSLTSVRAQNNVIEVFEKLYEKTKSLIKGVDIFAEFSEKYTPTDNFEEHVYVKDILKHTQDVLYYCRKKYEPIAKILDEEAAVWGMPLDLSNYAYHENALNELAEASSYDETGTILQKYLSGTEKPVSRHFTFPIWDELHKLYKNYFIFPLDTLRSIFVQAIDATSTLARFMKVFDREYMREKKRRGMFEHSDVEKFTYCLLHGEDGTPTDIALNYREIFSAIYIDEYQDVNELQNAIFEVISNGHNRFMVGDIKQSIYGFRAAKPEIFANMKSAYPKLVPNSPPVPSTIFLSENYRCDKNIIDFVNAVFRPLFSFAKNSIGYNEEDDKLYFKKVYPDGCEPPNLPVRVCLCEQNRLYSYNDVESMAHFIAREIKDLLDNGTLDNGRKIAPSDIAIVMRKKTHLDYYKKLLNALGIPTESEPEKDFFVTAEIRLMICLLNTIDNPLKDVYLAGVMCSPLYPFNANDLYNYKNGRKDLPLYRCICEYSEEHPEDARLSRFLYELRHYRSLCEGMNVDTLISRLYAETGIMALASRNGGKENLLLLYDYARKFEGSSYKGLYNFINYINNIIKGNRTIIKKANSQEKASGVSILSIHSSKGLEFPIVFITEATEKIRDKDANDKVTFTDDYGLSFFIRGDENPTLQENPAKHIMEVKNNEKYIEEELRILYVALTRAKERLYIVGALKKNETLFSRLKSVHQYKESLCLITLGKIPSYAELCLIGGEEFCKVESIETPKAEKIYPYKEDYNTEPEEIEYTPRNEEVYTELKNRFSFEYRDKYKIHLPEKMSVSYLYPALLDEDDTSLILPTLKSQGNRPRLPDFVSETREAGSAERGIATHLALQFCNFDNLEKNGVRAELCRLEQEGFISKDNAERVRVEELECFVTSKLFKELKSAKKIYRELRFNSNLPAVLFTEKEIKKIRLCDRNILVQGVIDCIYEDADGEMHVIDYKTDRLSKSELDSEDLARAAMQEKHGLQLTYYALAAEKIFGKKPKKVEIYSLHAAKLFPIQPFEF